MAAEEKRGCVWKDSLKCAKAWQGCAVGVGVYFSGHICMKRAGFVRTQCSQSPSVPPQKELGGLMVSVIGCRRSVLLQRWISFGFANTVWPHASCGK